MLLYNEKKFSVCPITTHIQLKNVDKILSEKKLKSSINNIINFYKKINKEINIIILGLNPHASIDFSENTKDKKLLNKVIKYFKKKRLIFQVRYQQILRSWKMSITKFLLECIMTGFNTF